MHRNDGTDDKAVNSILNQITIYMQVSNFDEILFTKYTITI